MEIIYGNGAFEAAAQAADDKLLGRRKEAVSQIYNAVLLHSYEDSNASTTKNGPSSDNFRGADCRTIDVVRNLNLTALVDDVNGVLCACTHA